MAIIKYPWRTPTYSRWSEFDEPFNRLARFFDEPFIRPSDGMWAPAVSMFETKDELVFTAELPGMSEKDITVEFENDVLTFSGEKTEERMEGDDERRYHLFERSYGSFRRSFALPHTVKGEEVEATFDKGILTVRLPKMAEAKGRKIEISKN